MSAKLTVDMEPADEEVVVNHQPGTPPLVRTGC